MVGFSGMGDRYEVPIAPSSDQTRKSGLFDHVGNETPVSRIRPLFLPVPMQILRFLSLLALLAAAGVPPQASASPLTWTLVGVTFSDGGTASGSFVFDESFTYS